MAAGNRAAALAANSAEGRNAREREMFLGAGDAPEAPGAQAAQLSEAAKRVQRRESARKVGRKALATFMAVVLAVGLMPLPAFAADGSLRGVSFNGNVVAASQSTTTTVDADGNVSSETTQTVVDDEGNVESQTTSTDLSGDAADSASDDNALDATANARGQALIESASAGKDTLADLQGHDATESGLSTSAIIAADKADKEQREADAKAAAEEEEAAAEEAADAEARAAYDAEDAALDISGLDDAAFATQRVVVALKDGASLQARDENNVASQGAGLYVLEYKNADAAKRAYVRYTSYEGAQFVAPDQQVEAAAKGDEDGDEGDDSDEDSDSAAAAKPSGTAAADNADSGGGSDNSLNREDTNPVPDTDVAGSTDADATEAADEAPVADLAGLEGDQKDLADGAEKRESAEATKTAAERAVTVALIDSAVAADAAEAAGVEVERVSVLGGGQPADKSTDAGYARTHGDKMLAALLESIDASGDAASVILSEAKDLPSSGDGGDSSLALGMTGEGYQEAPSANVRVLSIEALDSAGYGSAGSIYAALELAKAARADVVSMSFAGYNVAGNEAIEAGVRLFDGAGATLVAAAGNQGADVRHFVPAGLGGVTAVGALDAAKLAAADPADVAAGPAAYRRAESNYGAGLVWAPGASTSYAAATAAGYLAAGIDPASLQEAILAGALEAAGRGEGEPAGDGANAEGAAVGQAQEANGEAATEADREAADEDVGGEGAAEEMGAAEGEAASEEQGDIGTSADGNEPKGVGEEAPVVRKAHGIIRSAGAEAGVWAADLSRTSTSFSRTAAGNEAVTVTAGLYAMRAYGGRGGYSKTTTQPGGLGGYSVAVAPFEKTTTLQVYAGGQGENRAQGQPSGGAGGVNGGGAGGEAYGSYAGGGGGGGASHVATTAGTLAAINDISKVYLIAGGGGGNGNGCGNLLGLGGKGGGASGGDGYWSHTGSTTSYSAGGTQSGGYALWQGQAGRPGAQGSNASEGGGGGGGGYYGGKAYTMNSANFTCTGGGGGSGYVSDTLIAGATKAANGSTATRTMAGTSYTIASTAAGSSAANGVGKVYVDYLASIIELDAQGGEQSGATTVYAKPDADEYYAAYQVGSGGAPELASELDKLAVPTREGYLFNGYWTEEDGAGTCHVDASGNFVNALYAEGGKVTLYACWCNLMRTNTSFSKAEAGQGSTVAAPGLYKLEAWGGKGGNGADGGGSSGGANGGYSVAVTPFASATPLYAYAGGAGENRTASGQNTGGAGGANGGGAGGVGAGYRGGGGGGGASHVATASGTLEDINNIGRIYLIAGGGGGSSNGRAGGAGGGAIGGTGSNYAGTQSGSAGGTQSGGNKLWMGGTGRNGGAGGDGGEGGGGGGGGYYGGKANTASGTGTCTGGGGGSGYVSASLLTMTAKASGGGSGARTMEGTSYTVASTTAGSSAATGAGKVSVTYIGSVVTLDAQGGSQASTATFYAAPAEAKYYKAYSTAGLQDAFTVIAKPTRAWYDFGGYYSAEGGLGTQYVDAEGNISASLYEAGNITLYAKWTKRTYAVEFSAGSPAGSGAMVGVMQEAEAEYEVPACGFTAPEGYRFAGWKVDYPNSATSVWPGAKFTASLPAAYEAGWRTTAGGQVAEADSSTTVRLVAQWERFTTYSIGGSIASPGWQTSHRALSEVDAIVLKGSSDKDTATLASDGKAFAGWATTAAKASEGTVEYLPGAEVTAAGLTLYPVYRSASAIAADYTLPASGGARLADGRVSYSVPYRPEIRKAGSALLQRRNEPPSAKGGAA